MKAKSFMPLVAKAKSAAKNGGIFSNSGAGQKHDKGVKPSYGEKASRSAVRKAVDSTNIKVGLRKKG